MLNTILLVINLMLVFVILLVLVLKKDNSKEKCNLKSLEDNINYIRGRIETLPDTIMSQSAILFGNSKNDMEMQNKQLIETLSLQRKELNDNMLNLINGLSNHQSAIKDELIKIQSHNTNHIKETQEIFKNNTNNQNQQLAETLLSQRKEINENMLKVLENMSNMQVLLKNELLNMQNFNSNAMQQMQELNRSELDKINDTVNEKLQKTLDDRISKSFETIQTQLVEVYKGLGEMKTLASGVSDLKNVLSNVKTRGIIGEYQLEAILDEILTREQFETQAQINPKKSERVDFAIKLPGNGNSVLYLPIDSKFPGDTYGTLVDALDTGNKEKIDNARKSLRTTILSEAKSIHDKYICPPYTTDFAIMFLPFEGLYAEVVNMGILEEMQRKYCVNIAGPSTMAAILNSFRMGFRTLAIQKRSADVWKLLEGVKKEFETFEDGLNKMKERLGQADKELEKLVGTRTRAINRKLRDISISDMSSIETNDIVSISMLDD